MAIPLFGRSIDLTALAERATSKGLTTVVGRAQVGKTRLLEELLPVLRARGTAVGMAKSTGETSDLLLRGVADTYAAWIAEADSREKLRLLSQRLELDLVDTPMAFLEAVLDSVNALPGANILAKGIRKLRKKREQLLTGNLELPVLGYDQAHALVSLIAEVSNMPVAVILDGLERSTSIAQSAGPLRSFLDNLDEWPLCHFFLGVRGLLDSGDEAMQIVEELADCSAAASVYPLGRMNLEDPDESRVLVAYVLTEIPGSREASSEEMLRLIDGHPGVLARWYVAKPQTQQQLVDLTADAQAYRYRELESMLVSIRDDAPELAQFLARVAFAPQLQNDSAWERLKPCVQRDLPDSAITDLQAKQILELDESHPRIPTYGHATRHEAAQKRWLEDLGLRPYALAELNLMVPDLASRIREVSHTTEPLGQTLDALGALARTLPLDVDLQLLCECASRMVGDSFAPDQSLLVAGRAMSAAQRFPETAGFISLGLYSGVFQEKEEGRIHERDLFLGQLRDLQHAFPEDAVCRFGLAATLVQIMIDVKDELGPGHQQAYLDELREIRGHHPTDPVVARILAHALRAVARSGDARGEAPEPEALLEDLRELQTRAPDDRSIREALALALFDVAVNWEDEGPGFREVRIHELADLHAAFPEDQVVAESLAGTLAWRFSLERLSPAAEDQTLETLRTLRSEMPASEIILMFLSTVVHDCVLSAAERGDTVRRDLLMDELRAIQDFNSADSDLQASLAMALFDTLFIEEAGATVWNDPRHRELVDLQRRFPDSLEVRRVVTRRLQNGLLTTPIDATWTAQLQQLRELCYSIPPDEMISTNLARVLLRWIRDGNVDQDEAELEVALGEIRRIWEVFRNSPNIEELVGWAAIHFGWGKGG